MVSDWRLRFEISQNFLSNRSGGADKDSGEEKSKPMSFSPLTSVSSYSCRDIPTNTDQRRTEFQQLSKALQSGDVDAAEKAYTALSQGSSSSSSSASQTTPVAQDLQLVGQALQAGDVESAQKAFAQLQKDAASGATAKAQQAQSTSAPHRSHHHQEVDADNDGSTYSRTATISSAIVAGSANGSTSGTLVNLLA